jgi:quinoprotein glucose dehydrogenase
MNGNRRFLAWLGHVATACCCLARAAGGDEPASPGGYSPRIAEASAEGALAIARMQAPQGFKIELWAAEPLLANPVAFCIDARGRIFVAETFRQNKGVEDNRDHPNWLDDDLSARSVADRLAYFRKHLGDAVASYAIEHDRIRRLADTDGDGRADQSTLYADGFHGLEEGTGAGLLARGIQLWFTNIPKLWSLFDRDDDGVADERRVVHDGFGVRVAFRGHDLHGLRMGPDGRVYFSIGDRGFNVTTREYDRLVYPDQGAVLRMNPDGSELEVVHAGLRNPQELAFDQYGNLFTCDNNSDSGDRARWVYVVEGADSGWRMEFQYLPDRGPWNRERLWHPAHAGQPAWIVPPVAHFADGPSGLAYAPGTGFPAEYDDHFFLCDFRGTDAQSGVRAARLKPKGAGFELVDGGKFLWRVLATDVDFGPDGAMYVSDWVEGWTGPGKGRIYRVAPQEQPARPAAQTGKAGDLPAAASRRRAAAEASKWIAEGFAMRPMAELAAMLAHPNQTVRLEAQFALAARDLQQTASTWHHVAQHDASRLARLHALWGITQAIRAQGRAAPLPAGRKAEWLDPIVALLSDADPEMRAQSAKVLAEAAHAPAANAVGRLLADPEPRVCFFAALAYGKLARRAALPAAQAAAALADLLRINADQDPYLRHAGAVGMAELGNAPALLQFAADADPAVRRGVLLALRRMRRPEVARFLEDDDPSIVEEAARAIYDVPLPEAFEPLAALADRESLTEPALLRALGANLRLGGTNHARALGRVATRSALPEGVRVMALQALRNWARPSPRDIVLGAWRPMAPRDASLAAAVVRDAFPALLGAPALVRRAAEQAAVALRLKEAGPALHETLASRRAGAEARAEALISLAAIEDPQLDAAIAVAARDASGLVRARAASLLAARDPGRAVGLLAQALDGSDLIERQAAFATLADMKTAAADRLLLDWAARLSGGDFPLELRLDLLEAAERRDLPELNELLALALQREVESNDPLAAYQFALAGGDGRRGRQVFFEKTEVSCLRCHRVGNRGGDVGPDLSKIGGQQKREYLLEAIVLPDRQIAKGFEPVVLLMEDGKIVSGIVKEETGQHVKVINADGVTVTVAKSKIEERARGKSAMPEDAARKLSRRELRDLVEFLAHLK